MDRSTLKALVYATIALMVVVLIAGLTSGGMSSRTRALAQAELTRLEQSERELEVRQRGIESAFDDHPELFGDDRVAAMRERLERARTQLRSADERAAEARALLDENDEEKTAALVAAVDGVRAARAAAEAEIADVADTAARRVAFAKDRGRLVSELEAAHARVRGIDLGDLEQRVEAAIARWPDKREDLERRLAALRERIASADELWETVRTQSRAFTENPSTADLDAFFRAESALRQTDDDAPAIAQTIRTLLPQLDVSWDEILADMEIVDAGSRYQFFHTIKRVTTPAVQGTAPDQGATDAVEPKETTRRISVDRTTFKQHEKDLGMVLRHKPAGKYDSEATSQTQPPGFAYMAEKGGRNRYGYWESRPGGGSFWVWYGQYRLMSDLFYGPSYYDRRPIRYSSWNSWDRARSTGRTWYGNDRPGATRWGSGGSFASSRYASSSYKRNNGFTGSTWRSSSGSFRTSRYSSSRSRSRSSSGRGGYRSFRSRGSRSFGGK